MDDFEGRAEAEAAVKAQWAKELGHELPSWMHIPVPPPTRIEYTVHDELVRLEDVHLEYDGVPILRGVNASVRDIKRKGCNQGQVVGILGPSGVGKTQLSRVMAGLVRPTRGRVVIDGGKDVQAGLVGMVPQNYPLFNHRTVLGNLLVAARTVDRKEAEARCMGYLEDFGLADRASYYPAQLSGGQRQRVSIIQQLLCSEYFMIMDEPFTGLDPVMKDKTCDLIAKVSLMHEKNTIFIVAHDIHALMLVSDTLWLLGRDRSPDGSAVPGSYIKHTYDLAAMGLAWQPGISSTPVFAQLAAEVKERFKSL